MTIGFKPCGICGATVPDEPNELDALRAEVERLLAHRELCTENLLKGYETGKAEERAAVVAWLREEPERLVECSGHYHANGKTCFVLSPMPSYELAEAIERGEHHREEER